MVIEKPKFARRFRGYLLDCHSPDPPVVTLERLDPKSYIETYKAANIDSIIVYAKGHWGECYYDTKVGHKHPGPKGDLLAQMVEIGHQSDMEVAAYYSLGFDTWAAVQNPDWAQRNEDGTPNRACINPQKWHNMCCNTPYRDYALAQLAEIAGGYEVDGFFIDIFPLHWIYGICYCDYCERTARSMLGKRVSELSWNDQVEWTAGLRKVLWNEIKGTVKRLRPEAYVIVKDGMNWPGRLVANALRWLNPEPRIHVEGPSYVEATFSRQLEPDRLVVHLLNRSVSVYGEEAQPVGARLRLQKGWFSARRVREVWPEEKELGVRDCGRYLEVDVPPVQLHVIVTMS